MAVIKCKMCGGDLVIEPGATVAECEYCGTKQTIPNQDDEKKLTLFARANRLRMGCEFDKAAGIYESIVADFPQEAEAYWGLVLCKYGIEYVDDPATGKKIPTCHRSSFESIMEDSDFEQALENADVVARKVYRDEAKQIEEIRKGIIEVSGKEEPYDIFICYKETDENGQRTVDSVIAQDVYDALTEKGYRVFFSRITLEDKLGQEYEPYIFAALNSAKIMLAFGTDYEYYNAVWVKNEWSRYLKLMARDKTKHLIPCYKGIDAYDMPKEFAKLQAQDMGKVGAIQDLMRGIEKLLPRTDPSAPVQQVVQQVVAPADNRQSAQLDRGYMALEDGDWKKADGFFEEALNLDAHSAPAYIGKTLAQEKCQNLHALVLKKLSECQEVEAEERNIQPEESQLSHIKEAVQKYSIPGYFEPPKVKALYEYDFSYPSYVSGRERQLEDQKQWWDSHRFLSRAEQFATGDTARQLQTEKKWLIDALAHQVREAEKAEQEAIQTLLKNYEQFLPEADAKVEQESQNWEKEREKEYQEWYTKAQTEHNTYLLKQLASRFERLVDYQDSRAMADFCRNRAKEAEAAEEEEQERQSRLYVQRQERAARRKKVIRITLVVLLLLAIAGYFFATKVIVPALQHQQARNYLNAGDYDTGYAMLEDLGKHDEVIQNKYERGMELLGARDYEAAYQLLTEAGYEDAVKENKYERGMAFLEIDAFDPAYILLNEAGRGDIVQQNKYDRAMAMLEEDDYDSAYQLLKESGHGDIVDQSKYERGTALLKEKDYDNAYRLLEEIGENGKVKESKYDRATELFASEKYTEVISLLESLGKYKDSTDMILECKYRVAEELLTEGKTAQAAIAFGLLDDYKDARQRSFEVWDGLAERKTVDLFYHAVGVKSDGTVVTTEDVKHVRDDVGNWTDIVAVGVGVHTVGLKSDGTVVATGYNSDGECNVGNWTDIVAISTSGVYTVGLKSNGTVVATGSNKHGQCNVDDWTDIVAISVGGINTVGLRFDGTVVATGDNEYGQCDVGGWTNIVAISTSGYYTVGLKSDGTVVATGDNKYGQCDVGGWTNIVAISTSGSYTVGLKSDGTVVATGFNSDGECNVGNWTDIVAISAGYSHTVGLRFDGTVVATGDNEYGQCDVRAWTDIVAISVSGYYTVGLKTDGTVVVRGKDGLSDVGYWRDIRLPNKRT